MSDPRRAARQGTTRRTLLRAGAGAAGLTAAALYGLDASRTNDAERVMARRFGVLEPDRASIADEVLRDEQIQGLGLRNVVVDWSEHEPAENAWNRGYLDEVARRIERYRAAGFEMTLDLGLHYRPSWVFDTPNALLVNQYGDPFYGVMGTAGVNAVFSDRVRRLQERHVSRVFEALGTDFAAVRLGWGYHAELNYPSPTYREHANSYWAFDDVAQGRTAGLADGVEPCPVPGWRPGTPSAGHDAANSFLDWYLESLRNYQDWQISVLRNSFAGPVVALYGSNGVRPGEIEEAVDGDLGGSSTAELTQELQQGHDVRRLIGSITDPGVKVCCTCIDRAAGDDDGNDPVQWSAVRYCATLAREQGLDTWAENSGNADLAAMRLSFARMRRFDVRVLMWAFHSQLYDGRHANAAEFAELIAEDRRA